MRGDISIGPFCKVGGEVHTALFHACSKEVRDELIHYYHADPERVVAIVTERGGPTSHTAIIARQLGIVPQSPFLFSGTVADNIRYPKQDATDQEVMAAARSGERSVVTVNETSHLRRTGLPMGLFQGAR